MEAKKENKVLTWVKEHKAIIIEAGIIAGVIIGAILTKKRSFTDESDDISFLGVVRDGKTAVVVKPLGTFDTCKSVDLWSDVGLLHGVTDNIKVSDVGKFGEDLMRNVPGVTKDTMLGIIFSTKS